MQCIERDSYALTSVHPTIITNFLTLDGYRDSIHPKSVNNKNMKTEPFDYTYTHKQAIDDCLDSHAHKTGNCFDAQRQKEDKELLEAFIKRAIAYRLMSKE